LKYLFRIVFCAGGQTIRECELYSTKADNHDEAFSKVSSHCLTANRDTRSLLLLWSWNV